MSSELLLALEQLSERQVETFRKTLKVIEALEARVNLVENVALELRQRVALLEGAALGFQSRFPYSSQLEKALEKATEAEVEDSMVQDIDVVIEGKPKGAALADKIRSRATNGVPNDIEVRELEEMLAAPTGGFDEEERSPVPPAVGSRPGAREPGEEG
jgi:hypothetical protein